MGIQKKYIMKIKKNKIVFISVLATILLFIISYSILMLGDEENTEELKQTTVPKLKEEKETYGSKLEAINDLKEKRENNAPSPYDENLLDSLGYYDLDYVRKEKNRVVDSIVLANRISYNENRYERKTNVLVDIDSTRANANKKEALSAKEISLEHQLFFASEPSKSELSLAAETDAHIYAAVDGKQVVKKDYRLRMRLIRKAKIAGRIFPKNTPVFGFIKFQPNRAMVEINNINHQPVELLAFDLQDGNEGIYVENSFQADASQEVLDDVVGDINIPTIPQVSGITKIFRKSNRNVKITITNNYQLLLKPQL
jgi:hypothetical protein